MIDDPHSQLVNDCLSGNKKALEDLIKIFQPKIFSLAIKFLWEPEDAEDATQEILIKVITHLVSFRKEAKLSTWIYRIATNHLINVKKSKMENRKIHFDSIEKQLSTHNKEVDPETPNLPVLVYNIQIACTNAMLLCLSRTYRAAYILGEVFQVSSEEGAWILEISNELFRKRLSRARLQMEDFLGKQCGLTNSPNPCKCSNRIYVMKRTGRLQSYLEYSEILQKTGEWNDIKVLYPEVKKIRKAAEVFRNIPNVKPKQPALENLRTLINRNQFQLLN